jgi:hypothetical protein
MYPVLPLRRRRRRVPARSAIPSRNRGRRPHRLRCNFNSLRVAIANAVRRDAGKPASRIGFATSVGAAVPPQIELYVLPDAALAAVPDAKIVKYTTVQNQIVLVDPTTMRVVDVIPASPASP